MTETKIICDSVTPEGNRLTTFVLTYWRAIHSEFMTHRCFSRNASSSRAIPIAKMIEAIETEPAKPVFWGTNQAGMQASEQLGGQELDNAKYEWLIARNRAVDSCTILNQSKLHKQITNRTLEPFAHIIVVATASDRGLRNMFGLRAHKDAQPEFQVLAYKMLKDWLNSTPTKLNWGQWHVPFYENPTVFGPTPTDIDQLKIATGRIARVSYLTHDGVRDEAKDIELHDRLASSGHWSPFEHCAMAIKTDLVYSQQRSNFGSNWLQYRKTFIDSECQAPTDRDLKKMLDNMPEWTKEFV